MNRVLDAISRYALLKAAIYGLVGALIFAKPDTFFQFAVYILAGLFALMGLYNLLITRDTQGEAGQNNPMDFATGIMLMIGALVILIFAKPIVSVIPFFLGLFTVLSGIRQLVQEIRLRSAGEGRAPWFIFSFLMIIVGAILVFNPFKTVLTVFKMFGLVLIVLAIAQVVDFFQNSRD